MTPPGHRCGTWRRPGRDRRFSTLTLIDQEFILGGTPSGNYLGLVGLGSFNCWCAHKWKSPNRANVGSDGLLSMLADLTEALRTGEVPVS
mgnify:CR=1 FL=1